MKFIKPFIFFIVINIGSLALGSWLMNNGPRSNWYALLNKAPWTPPGWVFGVAWSFIMICFSIYLTYLYQNKTLKFPKIPFATQVFFNVIWNYIFFNKHNITLGLFVIIILLFNILYFLYTYKGRIRLLLLPYTIWLIIATSLNAYIFIYN